MNCNKHLSIKSDEQMENKLNFSNYEFWYLCSLMSPGVVIGFRNPMTGLLTEDMFPLIQEASSSLYDKDVIQVDTNSQIAIKEPTASLIRTISTPHTTILLTYRLNGNQKENIKSLHFDGRRVVLLEELEGDTYRIEDIDNKEDLISQLSQPFLDKIFWAPDTGNLNFPQSAMTNMQKGIENGDLAKAKENLEQVTGDEQSMLHFWETVQDPMIRYSLVGFINRNDPQKSNVNGFSILAGEHYIWLLEIIDEENSARVSKITLKELKKKIDALISFAS